MTVEPISAFTPTAPDADWETVRARLMAALTASVPTTWTDHNAVDPGVTLAEAAAFGLADLHYRTAERTSRWPVEVAAWLPAAERHWEAALPVGATATLADELATPVGGRTVAETLEPLVAACGSRGEALALLATAPWAALVSPARAPVAIALLRARRVRQVAHELGDLVATTVEAERAAGGTVPARDARAAAELAFSLPLWPEELTALVRRERRRLSGQAVLARLEAVLAATTTSAAAAVRGDLLDDELTADEADAAMAAPQVPVGAVPEDYEEADGSTRLWPPHPLQASTCEPVTAADYARRARTHPQVGRAWAVRGQLAGVAWDGSPVPAGPAPSARAGTVTLVVERVGGGGAGPDEAFLRDVLATAIGTEVVDPHPTWQDTLDPLDPRRLLCDEVGAALLVRCPVVLQGRLVTGVGADRAMTIGGALARVAAHFAAGRPESRPAPLTGPAVEGPWPRVDQPAAGWTPGEAIRFSEVVAVLTQDPAVLGVEDLAIRVGTGPFVTSTAGSASLDPACVPWLSDVQCLRVRFSLTGECADA